MYVQGDHVIAASGGIWQVIASEGNTLHLKAFSTGEEKNIAVNDPELIRKISDKEKVQETIDRVAFIRTIQAPNDKTRQALYDEAMAQYDEMEWVRVIKSVYLRAEERRLMPDELRYLERAKDYFHSEVAILFDLPLEAAEGYIAEAVSADSW